MRVLCAALAVLSPALAACPEGRAAEAPQPAAAASEADATSPEDRDASERAAQRAAIELDAGAPSPDRRWPSELAVVTPPEFAPPRPRPRRWRVYIDAGHGAPGNQGTRSAFCEAEEDFTLRAAEHLAARLEETGAFRVKLSRKGAARPSYRQRVAEAQRWRADALLSLHADARGWAHAWEPRPGLSCWRSDGTPGFSILWSDDAPGALQKRRVALARALAAWMERAGFLPYDGVDYTGLYEGDPQPGVFVDRHVPGQRIYMLRRPRVPSVIIETHHALDVREASRWREARVLDAFSAAVANALAEVLSAEAARVAATR